MHKNGVPLRPILDMCNSPYHATAKWLAELMEQVRKKLAIHSLRDSFEFVDTVKQLSANGMRLLSLDVTSLFTNIPPIETIEFLGWYVESNDMSVEIPVDELKQFLYRCTYNVQFR